MIKRSNVVFEKVLGEMLCCNLKIASLGQRGLILHNDHAISIVFKYCDKVVTF